MAFTVEQCRKVVRLQRNINVLSSMLVPSCPGCVEKMIKITIEMHEKEITKLLFKKQ